MDNNSTDGTDKRSWRERLGIGNKEMPKISDDFKSPTAARTAPPAAAPSVGAAKVAPRAPTAPRAPAPVAKPAPMAPRAAALAPAPQPTQSPEALASKLKSQRDAAEKLAEQRIRAARQKAEFSADAVSTMPNIPRPANGAANNGTAKPKFIFADEDSTPQVSAPPPPPPPPKVTLPPRPVTVPPPAAPQTLQPARAPLGADRPVAPPRPVIPQQPLQPPPQQYAPQQPAYIPQQMQPPAYQPQQPYPPQLQYQPQQPAFRQPGGYRPIDPNSGYAPPPGGFTPPPQRGYAPPPQQPGPRLNVPPRAPAYPPQGEEYEAQAPMPEQGFSRIPSRPMRPMAAPPADIPMPGDDEVFASPRPSRRTPAADYGQAYREYETGYEEEEPKSRAPLFLVLALLTSLLMAGGVIWWYQKNKTNTVATGGTTTEQNAAPVVEAQPEPPKVTAEQPVESGNAPSTKQIYDRIVGDKEVLGNNLSPTEEAPVEQNGLADPAPAGGNAEDAAPLPLPPPPGENGEGQEGSLQSTPKSESQQIAAAGESQAAVAPSGGVSASLKSNNETTDNSLSANQAATPDATPAPAATAATAAEAPVPGETPVETSGETVGETSETQEPDPVVTKPAPKKVVAKKPALKKTKQQASLGAKPVVLVPAQKVAKTVVSEESAPVESTPRVRQSEGTAGIYGEDLNAAAPEAQQAQVAAPQPKKKTLLGTFLGGDNSAGADDLGSTQVASAPQAQPKRSLFNQAPKVEAPETPEAPAVPKQVASAGSGGYVAQLASFPSQGDANKAYATLKSKYPQLVSKYPPVISTATVAGSTRYRLALGSLGSQSAASQLCNQLLSAGERDCLAKRQ